MEGMVEFCSNNYIYITAGLAVVGTTILLLRKFIYPKKQRICGISYPKDTVILHQFVRGGTVPSLGHFVMKLETYLRINKIPYQSNYNTRNGPKGKVPWIEYNGITMGDSQMIIQFLNKEFRVDMDIHLSTYEKALAWAIQKWIEEFMYCERYEKERKYNGNSLTIVSTKAGSDVIKLVLNVHTRWVIFCDDMFSEGISVFPKALKPVIRKKAVDMTYKVGVGRHSNEEVHDMMVHDLRQFSEILGNKQYLMGDRMSVVDCSAFGILSQIRWGTPSKCPGTKLLQSGEISNVVNYLDRIKQQYWPDWDSPQVETNTG